MISFRGKKHYPFTKLEKNSFHILQKSEVNKNWKDEWRSTGSLYKKEFWLDCLSITHNHDLRMILLATVSLACCFVDDEGMNKWCCPVPNYGRHWIDLSNHLLILYALEKFPKDCCLDFLSLARSLHWFPSYYVRRLAWWSLPNVIAVPLLIIIISLYRNYSRKYHDHHNKQIMRIKQKKNYEMINC